MDYRIISQFYRQRRMISVFAFIFAWSITGLVYAAEDDYLKSLEIESQKIRDTKKIATEVGGGEDSTVIDAQRNEFESYMSVKHKGTYAFYRKLPDRSREEIFKAFVDGASMGEIRTMTIDRKLNR